MFLYWDGYEIDGSDTAYNLVVPAKEVLLNLVEYFLSLPLWNRNTNIYFDPDRNEEWAPHRLGKEGQIEFSCYQEILDTITSPEWNGQACIVVNCLPPEMLPDSFKKELYQLSPARPELEEAFGKVDHPGATLKLGGESAESLYVGLQLSVDSGTWDTGNTELEGMVLNHESLAGQMGKPFASATFTCGPGYYYEYAAFIVGKIAERFPQIGLFGGLDCGGGFTRGCTYSSSLYNYERLRIPLSTVTVRENIERLCRQGLISLPLLNRNEPWKPWQDEPGNMITLVNQLDDLLKWARTAGDPSLAEVILAIMAGKYRADTGTYSNLVRLLLANEGHSPQLPFYCAAYVRIVSPHLFEHNPEAAEVLSELQRRREEEEARRMQLLSEEMGTPVQRLVPSFWNEGEWLSRGFMTVSRSGGEEFLELWVNWRFAPCVKELLGLLPGEKIFQV